jgi:hypothetical protein
LATRRRIDVLAPRAAASLLGHHIEEVFQLLFAFVH